MSASESPIKEGDCQRVRCVPPHTWAGVSLPVPRPVVRRIPVRPPKPRKPPRSSQRESSMGRFVPHNPSLSSRLFENSPGGIFDRNAFPRTHASLTSFPFARHQNLGDFFSGRRGLHVLNQLGNHLLKQGHRAKGPKVEGEK